MRRGIAMKKRIFFILVTVMFLLSINPAFSQDRPVLITLIDGTTLTDVNMATQQVAVWTDYADRRIIAFKDIQEIEFNQLKTDGKIKIIFKNGSVLENASFSSSKLNVESKILGKFEIPIDKIQSIFC